MTFLHAFNMTVTDMLKIHGTWIESKQLVSLIVQKMNVSERQAYRNIKDAFIKNEIKKVQLPDRSVLYGLAEFGPIISEETLKTSAVMTLSFYNAFLYQSFKKLEEIQKIAANDLERALRDLMWLIATFPEELKENIKPLQDQIAKFMKEKGVWFPPHGFLAIIKLQERGDANNALQSECYSQVLRLVSEISRLLHEDSRKKR